MFWEMAKKWPDREALVTENRRMTYREVREEALYISEQLRNEGVKKGEIVGVLMEKGMGTDCSGIRDFVCWSCLFAT